jgi:hypothetical protein
LAAVKHFGFTPGIAHKRQLFLDVIVPGLGFVFCLVIFLGLQGSTLVVGTVWLAMGGLYVMLKTKIMGQPVVIDFGEP